MVRPRSPSSLLRGEQEQGAQPMIRIAKAKSTAIATLGVDIGKNTFHLVGLDKRGAIVLRERLSRSQIEIRLANMAPCLVGMEACVGAHHLGRRVEALGHDVRLMAAKYVRPFCRKQKNDFNDAQAIAEAVTRPTVRCVALKTPAQLDLQALHRVRQRLMPGCRLRRWGAGCRRDLDTPGRSRIDRRQRWRSSPRDLIGCFRYAPRLQSVSRLAPAVALVSGGSVAALPLACRVEATVVDRTRDVIAYQWMETPGDCRNSRSWASRLPWISFPLAGSSVGTNDSPFRYRRSSVVACAHP